MRLRRYGSRSFGSFGGAAAVMLACVVGLSAQTGENPRAYEEVTYTSGKLKIEAYVYRPEGAGPFAAVVYNHGSRAGRERMEMPFRYVGEMLAKSGYVLIVPERRGYGKSDGVPFVEEIGEERGPRYVKRLQDEADDVIAAEEFAKTLPYVDGKRIAVMGWSFGGIVSVFAASRSGEFRAVVDQAGGSLSWRGSPALQEALKKAGGKIHAPLLGMVAQNDATTESVNVVVEKAKKGGGEARLIVYPAFTPRENPGGVAPGHMIFSAQGVGIWEKDVEEFLEREMGPKELEQ